MGEPLRLGDIDLPRRLDLGFFTLGHGNVKDAVGIARLDLIALDLLLRQSEGTLERLIVELTVRIGGLLL